MEIVLFSCAWQKSGAVGMLAPASPGFGSWAKLGNTKNKSELAYLFLVMPSYEEYLVILMSLMLQVFYELQFPPTLQNLSSNIQLSETSNVYTQDDDMCLDPD